MENVNRENISKKISELEKNALDIMSHKNYGAGRILIDVNCRRGSATVHLQREEKTGNQTIVITEDL